MQKTLVFGQRTKTLAIGIKTKRDGCSLLDVQRRIEEYVHMITGYSSYNIVVHLDIRDDRRGILALNISPHADDVIACLWTRHGGKPQDFELQKK